MYIFLLFFFPRLHHSSSEIAPPTKNTEFNSQFLFPLFSQFQKSKSNSYSYSDEESDPTASNLKIILYLLLRPSTEELDNLAGNLNLKRNSNLAGGLAGNLNERKRERDRSFGLYIESDWTEGGPKECPDCVV